MTDRPKIEGSAERCANCGKAYSEHLLHDENKCSLGSIAGWFPNTLAKAMGLFSTNTVVAQDGIERAREFFGTWPEIMLGTYNPEQIYRMLSAHAASEVSRDFNNPQLVSPTADKQENTAAVYNRQSDKSVEYAGGHFEQQLLEVFRALGKEYGYEEAGCWTAEDAVEAITYLKREVSRVRRETLALLQKHEWDGGRLGVGQCPICSYEAYSHLKNCWLAAAIRKLMDEAG